MTTKTKLLGTLAGLGLLGLTGGTALASSHREAPAIANDPAADNTDTWAWVTKTTHDKINIVVGYNPLEEPAGGPNFHQFSDDVLYEVHITKGATSLRDFRTYQFRFRTSPLTYVDVANLNAPLGGGKEFFAQLSGQKQTVTVTMLENGRNPRVIASDVPVAPVNIGPRTFTVAYKGAYGTSENSYNDGFAASFIKPTSEGGRVWAGPRDDGFYVDLGGVFDLAALRAKGTAQDGVAGYNVHAIALEIPTTQLTGGTIPTGASDANLLGVWASASRRQVSLRLRNGETFSFGPWVQVSRLGLPLINEAVIGLQDKDRWNYSAPYQESYFFPYFLNPIIVRDAEAVGIYGAGGLNMDPTPFKSNRLDIVDVINLKALGHNVPLSATGDVLRISPGLDPGFPNGRAIPYGATAKQEQADVTDVLLSVLLTKGMKAVSDGVDYNDKNFLNDIPWLALPFDGASQGHGKPTP